MSPASARSASESSSFPPPAATPEQAASLRADLADSGWGVEAVAALLGEAADAVHAIAQGDGASLPICTAR